MVPDAACGQQAAIYKSAANKFDFSRGIAMKKITDILDKIFHYLTALSFGLVSICVLVQVITRYTPGISAPWTDEMTRLFFMYTIMFGAPMAIKYSEYAVIDIVTNNMHGPFRHIINILDYVFICVVGVAGTKQAHIFWKTGLRTVSTSLRINMGIFYLVPVGIFALTSVYCVSGIIREILEMGKGEE